MNSRPFLALVGSLLIVPGCGHKSNEAILQESLGTYQNFSLRYESVLKSSRQDTPILMAAVRQLGIDVSFSFGESLWASLSGNDHVIASSGSPLHRALYVMRQDARKLSQLVRQFEQRGLFDRPIYKLLYGLRIDLCAVMRVVESQQDYSQEAQFIESQEVQKALLNQSYQQKVLLADIASQPRSQTTTVINNPKKVLVKTY